MFAALLAVILSADPHAADAPRGLAPAVASRARYYRWLHCYPYSTAISQRGAFNYRLDQDYPWSVRSGYSLPDWAAAESRVLPSPAPDARAAPQENYSPSGRAATSSR